MILRLVIPNSVQNNGLQDRTDARCPHSCPSVEVERNLARVVTAWPQLSTKQKEGLTELAVSVGR